MKKIYLIPALILLAGMLPGIASAHALPVATTPASSAVLDDAPSMVSMTFSEHVDPDASTVKVTDASGTVVSGRIETAADRKTLEVPVKTGGGTYLVSWSVVSSDDGHFTRGAYPFAVGKDQIITSSAGSDVEIVEIATAPEALASAIELFGHGLLWAILLLFAFAIRPLVAGSSDGEVRFIRRLYVVAVSFGVLFVVGGALAQILVKSVQLASLQAIDLSASIRTYLDTAAGSATAYRILAVSAFALVFFVGRKKILSSKKITVYEAVLFAALLVFAFMRAKISHATSNPFHPEVSIFFNFLHVIEKDIWSGILTILLSIALFRRMRRFLDGLIPRAFRMLAIDFGAVSITAAYIIWLHLKSFGNVFTTQWGGVFLELMLMAVVLVLLRTYHVFARTRYPRLFSRSLPASLSLELAAAIMVVYISSVVIITSPPLPHPPAKVFGAHDQGLTIELTKDIYEEGQLLLTSAGSSGAQTPIVTVQDAGSIDEPAAVNLSRRFSGGYVFPESVLVGNGPFTVSISVPQSDGYDAHATFVINKGDFADAPGWEGRRSFDAFTLILMCIALLAGVYAWILYKQSQVAIVPSAPPHRFMPALSAIPVFVAALFGAGIVVATLHDSWLENPFAAQCRADGNEWHIMLPTVAGIPTSRTPAEGCMWGMGKYMYMFPDRRAYEYYSNLGPATVTIDTIPRTLIVGAPSKLTVHLTNQDGTPATLFVDMEKIIHVVIISKDEKTFAHIHPDDVRALSSNDLARSAFTLDYTFPKSGEYLIAVDYAHGTVLESRQFTVQVGGAPSQEKTAVMYPTEGSFGGYDVKLDYPQPQPGEITTIKYTITHNGAPVELVPYLSAAMHVAAVKNDFSWYAHVHGEYHVPGTPVQPLSVRNGQVLHTMAMMQTPDTFTSPIEAHVVFPSAGLYTVWGQFKTRTGEVIATAFTVRVE